MSTEIKFRPQQLHGDRWLDWRGEDARIQFEEAIAWAELPPPFHPSMQ
jgi:hypothetical protein